MQALIEERVEQLVRDVMNELRSTAMAALSNALSSQGKLSPEAPKPSKGTRKRKGVTAPKRSEAQLEEIADKLYRAIEDDPGDTMLSYQGKLGMSQKELAVPLRRLKDAGRVRKVGERSDTTYFPMDSDT